MKKILATIFAVALGLGAWAADPVTIQDAGGNNISVYEVSSGFYQNGTTYNNSTDFYITNVNGLKFFRDIVNGETAASYAYFTATGVTGTYPTTPAGVKNFHSNNMFNGKTVHLLADIDLAGEQWITIGFNRAERTITDPDTSASASVSKCTFYGLFDAGIYDGEGVLTGTHVISNLDTSWQYVPEAATLQEKYQLTGLFGQLSGGTTAGVKNLTVRNATVVGRTDVGVIAGRSYNGGAKIENCHVVGNVNVSGTGTYIGGLVGECRASIVNSSVDAAAGSSISGLAYVGGLAGSVFQYNANDSVEVSGSAVSNTAVNASYSGVAGVGALVGVTNPSGTYHGNVVISGNEANNVPVSAPNSSASKGGVGTLVGNALYDDGAYAIVADNTVSGTTSATAGGDTVTVKMGEANDNIAVGANVTFDANNKITGGIFEVINEEVIAEGYLSTDNLDTTTSASYPLTIGGPYYAQVGTTGYASLAAAVDAASDGNVITILAGGTFEEVVGQSTQFTINKSVTIDFNGKTVTAIPNSGFNVQADGTVLSNGTLRVVSGSSYVVRVNGAEDVVVDSLNTYGGVNANNSTVTLANNDIHSAMYYSLCSQGGSVVTVNSGTYHRVDSDGGYEGAQLIYCPGGSSVKIEGGTFQNSNNFATWNWLVNGSGNVAITGGTFYFDPTDHYGVKSAWVTDNGNGTWTVVAPDPVAMIGDTLYYSLEDAVADTDGWDPIVLLTDIDLGSDVLTLDKMVMLYGAEDGETPHALTGTVKVSAAADPEEYVQVEIVNLVFGSGSVIDVSDRGDGDEVYFTLTDVTAEDTIAIVAGDLDGRKTLIDDVGDLTAADFTATLTSGYELHLAFGTLQAVKWVASVNGTKFEDIADAIAFAELSGATEITVLNAEAVATTPEGWRLADGKLTKIAYVAQIVSANGAITNKYETLLAALEAATNGTAVELLSDLDENVNLPALQNVTLDFCGHTVTGQLKGSYSNKINGFVVKNGAIVGRDSSRWANLQIASGSKNVVVTNMTLTTVRPNVSTAGYAFYNQSGSSIPLQDVVADGRFYVGNSGSVIAIESGTYRNTVGAAQAIQNNGVVAAKGGTFYYNPTMPDNLVADGYVATETTDGENVQCWVIERGPSLATVTLTDGTVTEYWDVVEAINALQEGATLTIKPGEYTLAAGTGAAGAYNLPANVTIVGAGESASSVRISSLNQTDPKGLILSGSGITVSNIYFKAEQNEGSALVIRGSGTVVDCVLDGMNETYHCVSDGMYQGVVNGTLHFLRCSILAERYAINVGETSGEVIIEDCTVKGWSSFGSGVKVTVLNTTFAEGTVTDDYGTPYNDIRFYDDAFISNCTFNAQMEVNICNEGRTGIKLIVDDSTYQGEGKLSSIITESASQSSASSSDIANNYVAVGTGIELDENGYITGGLFETVDNALIAPECVTGSNSDGETNVAYPTAVGLLRVTDIVQQPGATETQATYAVTAVVVNDEGETIGIVANQQMIEVSIAAADVASSTLAKFDVSKVLESALAAAGEDAPNVTKVEIRVVISSASSGEGSVAYEVHPEAVVTVTKNSTDTTTTIPLSNVCLAANAAFTFDLEVTGVVEAGNWAKVTHVSADPQYPVEVKVLEAVAGDGGKVYVTVTTTHFSTFTVGAGVPPVTFAVRSDNLFGSIKIEGNVASNLYVAVPFEGFEADGALRKAQDVVHATNLTAGTKMYVYDKNADKYDVFEVDANGKWAAADKLTVNVEGKATFDTADLTRGVTNGTGVIVGRNNTAETVYVYGQVPKIPIASTTFGAGQTLVSPPYTNGVEYVDLNVSTWTGVKATGKKRLKNLAGADYIQFRTADNMLVKYYYLEGEGWGVVPTQVSLFSELVANGKALIPVGTAFWYYSNAGGAKVEWK